MNTPSEKNLPSNQSFGHIPETGMISGDELASRLKLRGVRGIQDCLQESGVIHITLCGKRVYRCEDILKLFKGAK